MAENDLPICRVFLNNYLQTAILSTKFTSIRMQNTYMCPVPIWTYFRTPLVIGRETEINWAFTVGFEGISIRLIMKDYGLPTHVSASAIDAVDGSHDRHRDVQNCGR